MARNVVLTYLHVLDPGDLPLIEGKQWAPGIASGYASEKWRPQISKFDHQGLCLNVGIMHMGSMFI